MYDCAVQYAAWHLVNSVSNGSMTAQYGMQLNIAHENPPSESWDFHADRHKDGRTDGQAETWSWVAFRNFLNAPQNK